MKKKATEMKELQYTGDLLSDSKLVVQLAKKHKLKDPFPLDSKNYDILGWKSSLLEMGKEAREKLNGDFAKVQQKYGLSNNPVASSQQEEAEKSESFFESVKEEP